MIKRIVSLSFVTLLAIAVAVAPAINAGPPDRFVDDPDEWYMLQTGCPGTFECNTAMCVWYALTGCGHGDWW
jgi:hypothetical protein